MEDVFLKYEYGVRDVAAALEVRAVNSPRGRAGLAIGSVAVAVLALLLSPAAPSWVRVLSLWVVALALVQAAFALMKVLPYALFRRTKRDVRWTPEVRRDLWNRQVSVDASEDGITVTVGRRSSSLKWRDCVRFARESRAYLLWLGEGGYLVVPRRAFRNAKKELAFYELLTHFVGAATREEPASDVVAAAPPVPGPEPLTTPDELLEPAAPAAPPSREPARSAHAGVGRNDPCPCGSGKKYKRCCLSA